MREAREVAGIRQVSLKSFGEVLIQQGEQDALEIEANEDAMARIRTEVQGDTLVIDMEWPWKWLPLGRPRVTYHLTMREITGLEIAGAGTIRADRIETDRLRLGLHGAGSIAVGTLKAEELTTQLSGTGSLEVAGQVIRQEVSLSGAGAYEADDLRCQQADVRLSGVGKATVWVEETLDGQLSGVGSLEYYGNPTVAVQRSGVGRVGRRGAR